MWDFLIEKLPKLKNYKSTRPYPSEVKKVPELDDAEMLIEAEYMLSKYEDGTCDHCDCITSGSECQLILG